MRSSCVREREKEKVCDYVFCIHAAWLTPSQMYQKSSAELKTKVGDMRDKIERLRDKNDALSDENAKMLSTQVKQLQSEKSEDAAVSAKVEELEERLHSSGVTVKQLKGDLTIAEDALTKSSADAKAQQADAVRDAVKELLAAVKERGEGVDPVEALDAAASKLTEGLSSS
jgi:predicted  nucleic acid-binding Zn-ribbon protein